MSEHLSMPDPCSHYTRLQVIGARLRGDLAVLEHFDTCEEVA